MKSLSVLFAILISSSVLAIGPATQQAIDSANQASQAANAAAKSAVESAKSATDAAMAQASKMLYEFNNTCAYGHAIGKTLACDSKYTPDTTWTDPTTGKRYCFVSAEMKTKFTEDIKGNLAKAESNAKSTMVKPPIVPPQG